MNEHKRDWKACAENPILKALRRDIGSYSERRRLVANRLAGGYFLLDRTDDASVQKLVEINIRTLAEIAARKTSYSFQIFEMESRHNSADDLTVHVRKPEVAARVAVDQPLVVQAEQMEDSGVQVV
jgi:hypothetical protein